MKLAILHLSDIHIRDLANPALSRGRQIASTMSPLLPEVDAAVVVVTGDIAFSGVAEQYKLAEGWLLETTQAIQENFSGDLKLIVVPGNHDGRFKDSSQARDTVIDRILQKGEQVIDQSVVSLCTDPQDDYFKFEQRVMPYAAGDELWKEVKIEIQGKTVAFSCVNASWMSNVPETPGKLMFPIGRYHDEMTAPADVKVVVMHHPLNWYGQSSYHAFRDACRAHFQIVMSGHEHTGSTYTVDDSQHGRCLMLEAPALVPHGMEGPSGFSVLCLDTDHQRVSQVMFAWNGKMYAPEKGLPIWDSFMDLPQKRSDGFEPTSSIMSQLEDVGATFTHPNVERICMSHIFVYPYLHDLDTDSLTTEPVRSDILISQLDTLQRIIIRGEEQYGKTTLLHRLFSRYFEAGFIPLIVSGKDLHGSSPEALQRRILRFVQEQYGDDAIVTYSQLAKDKKIILIDDLDTSGTHPDLLAKTLEQVEKHYQYIIATVSETFDLTELASSKAAEITRGFRKFKIAGFGLELRTEIIKRWARLSPQASELEFQKRVHEAQSIIDTVIGKGLVPTSALSVLILLQTIETGQRTALANAGLAQYYEYMVRRALIDAKVKADELDEVLNYLGGLAWMFSENPGIPIEQSQIEAFNAEFSKNIQKTDFLQRLDLLLRARILKKVGSCYLFRYPYIRFFFKAQYLSANMEDYPELKNYVTNCCRHLYLSENANTILFLTHHTSSKWIIKEVGAVLARLLSDVPTLDISNDTAELNKWVTTTARVAIDVTDVEGNRRRQRAKEDRLDRLPEKQQDKELSSLEELDLVGQVNLLFKTSEILGQILKNKYGSLEKALKSDLISHLLTGPLRGVNVFLQAIIAEPEAIIGMIGDRLKEKLPSLSSEHADRIAQRYIFESLGNIADSFITRQGDLIGSPKLMDDISNVVGSNSTFKLVKVAAQLSYPNNIPFGDIELLAKELKNNVFGFRLLQGLAARHMYMFSVPYDERQRLAHATQIDVQTNRTIDLNSSGAKKVSNRSGFEPRSGKSLILRLQASLLARFEAEKRLAKK